MKHSAPTMAAFLGAASALGCAAIIDTPPTLASPAVAPGLTSDLRPAARLTLDTIVLAVPEPRPVGPLAGNVDSVQHMAAMNVITSLSSLRPVPTPTRGERREPVTPAPIASYTFGESAPVLSCTVLRACVIELETAETLVDNPIAGDQARWIITTARTGKGGASTLVIVKPKACDVTTNLILSTDRRIYDLDLDSPPCPARSTNPKRPYTRHLRFSYPSESDGITVRAARESRLTESADSLSREPERFSVTESVGKSDTVLNTRYRVVRESRGPLGLLGSKRPAFPWQPTRIADDGSHVYVSLPAAARKYASPVLYALEDDGSRTIVNYNLRDTVIVTDRLFKRGVLVIPSGKQEQKLIFENRAWNDVPKVSERP